MTSVDVYRKSESLDWGREAGNEDVKDRLRVVAGRVASYDLTTSRRQLLQRACQELLSPSTAHYPHRFSLRPFVVEELRRLPDDLWPRYLVYRYRYEVWPMMQIVDYAPPCLQIEPTSVCNYRCTFCYQTDGEFTKKANGHMGHMSLDLFKQVVYQAKGSGIEAVTLASRGEPLLHPEIIPMLDYLRGKFVASKVNTNAWFLDEEISHALLRADLNTLVFSVDAASEPLYSQLRVGGHLERVRKNIEQFADIKRRSYPDSRTIVRISGVKVDGTPGLADMEAYWGSLVDQVAFVTYNPWENTYERPVNDLETACSDLWRRMFVWWDGTVNPCDVDYKSTLAMGRVQDASVADLWRSDAYMDLRLKHRSKERSACSPCNRCTVV